MSPDRLRRATTEAMCRVDQRNRMSGLCTRSRLPARTVLGLLVLLAALAATPAGTACEPTHAADRALASRVGENVQLAGHLEGPAKIADFIRVDGQPVYLPVVVGEPARPDYGTRVVARGVLRHFEPPADGCTPGPDCFDAVVPAHYWLEHARLEVPED